MNNGLLSLLGVMVLLGCQSDAKTKGKGSESGEQSVPSATALKAPEKPGKAAAASSQRSRPRGPSIYSIPVGPVLGILPGQGLGPIRFGATVATIERHMQSPCTTKTETHCRYVAQAVEFHLKDGVLRKIQIHGDERRYDDNPEHSYGIFNGLFEQQVRLGMYRDYVLTKLGEPLKSKVVKPKEGANPTQRVDIYKDVRLEYDKLKNGNVVLAGVVLEGKPPTKKK